MMMIYLSFDLFKLNVYYTRHTYTPYIGLLMFLTSKCDVSTKNKPIKSQIIRVV